MKWNLAMETSQYWDKKLEKYATADWANAPSLFAEWAISLFPPAGMFLELGAGHGQDSRFFAEKGYKVISTDFSKAGLEYNRAKLPPELEKQVSIQLIDIAEPLPFGDGVFDVVYSHLALHYFDHKTTESIFREVHRVLKAGGILALLLNSTSDPEYGQGIKIEDDLFEIEGIQKRYFSIDSIRLYASDFREIVADNKGETYKDRAKGTEYLIRSIGRK